MPSKDEMMRLHAKHILRREQFIASQFSSELMSDAKWRKVFRLIRAPEMELVLTYVKCIDDDVIRTIYPLELRKQLPGLADAIGECWIGDVISGGPLRYRDIEWLDIPRESTRLDCPPYRHLVPSEFQQDVAAVERALAKLGRFPTELTEAGLRIWGYR